MITPLQPISFADLDTPNFAICSYSTPHNSIYDDLDHAAEVGAAAVGLWEGKFIEGDDDKLREYMQEHNVATSTTVPKLHAILEAPFDRPETPKDPRDRTELICRSVERLAAFDPVVIAVAPFVDRVAASAAMEWAHR